MRQALGVLRQAVVNRSHGSLRLTQMWTSGRIASGSSRVASDTPIRAGGSFGTENIGVPQRAQDIRTTRGELGHPSTSPDRSRSSARNTARAKKAPPVAFWQSRQWHTRTFEGSARALHRTWPHRQPP